MKTMTCTQMGGMCEAKISGATPEEMMKNGMTHMEAAHPEMATNIKTMSKDDPKMVEWNKKFMNDFAALPEDK